MDEHGCGCGICELDWSLSDESFFFLIGCGDSTKGTILDPLRRVFNPQRNLAFDAADFYQCSPTNAIAIEVYLGDIPDVVFRERTV